MRVSRWAVVTTVALVVGVGGAFLLVSASAQESPATSECDGVPATILATSAIATGVHDGKPVVEGTPGDDRVVLEEGVVFHGNGGTDLLCNSKGELEATIVPSEDPVLTEADRDIPAGE